MKKEVTEKTGTMAKEAAEQVIEKIKKQKGEKSGYNQIKKRN